MSRLARHPILVGVVVELVTGTLALVVAAADQVPYQAVFVGAVCGGATAAYLADQGPVRDVLYAVAADLTSSAAFFVLVIGGFVLWSNADPPTAILATVVLGLWGLVIAIPVGMISLVVAIAAGSVTTLARWTLRALKLARASTAGRRRRRVRVPRRILGR